MQFKVDRAVPRARHADRWFWLVPPATAAPALVAAVSALVGKRWFPVSDWALEVLRIGDVGTRHTTLVGAPSRFGWYHPGPLYFWLMAPFQAVLGPNGTLFGTGLLNGGALAGAVTVLRRRAGVAVALLGAIVFTGLVRGLGISFLINPWNPWVSLLPFLLYVLLVWAAAAGDGPLIPVAVVVGSFTAQAHVGYAPMVVGVAVLGVAVRTAGWLVRRRDTARGETAARSRLASRQGPRTDPEHQARTWRGHLRGVRKWRWALLGALVGVVAWLPPLIQQFAGNPGNLGELFRYFSNPPEKAAGFSAAVKVMGIELRPPGPWLTGHDLGFVGFLAPASPWPAVLVLAGVAALGLAAWRAGSADAALLALFAVVMAALGLVATARVTGPVWGYLFRWWWIVACSCWLAGSWCVAVLIGRWSARLGDRFRVPYARLALAGGLSIALIGLGAGTLATELPVAVPYPTAAVTVRRLADATASRLSRSQRYLVVSIDTLRLGGVAVGLFTELDRRGFQVRGQSFLTNAYGSWRVAEPSEVDAQLLVVAQENVLAGWTPPPGARQVAVYEPVNPGLRNELARLEASIRSKLPPSKRDGVVAAVALAIDPHTKKYGIPTGELRRLAALQRQEDRYTVYLVPSH